MKRVLLCCEKEVLSMEGEITAGILAMETVLAGDTKSSSGGPRATTASGSRRSGTSSAQGVEDSTPTRTTGPMPDCSPISLKILTMCSMMSEKSHRTSFQLAESNVADGISWSNNRTLYGS